MSTSAEIMAEASGVFLNDTPQSLFSNTVLLPYLKRSFADLQLAMNKKNIPTLKEISVPITVAPLGITLILPSDFILPVKLEERASGSSDFYTPMENKDYEANILQTDRLRYWTYREDQIKFPGATVSRQVLLYYMKGLTIPTNLNSPIGVVNVENYLSAQTAAYAAKFVMQSDSRAETLFSIAQNSLEDFMTVQLRSQQFQPSRQQRYLSKYRRRSHR